MDWKNTILIIQFNINNTVSNVTIKSPFKALLRIPMQVKLTMPEDLAATHPDRNEPKVEKAGEKQSWNCKSCNNKKCCCFKNGTLCGKAFHIETVCKNV